MQRRLAEMHVKGEGVQQDAVQTYMWCLLCETTELAEKKIFDAMHVDQSKFCAKLRKELAQKLTGQQIAEAGRLARQWWEKRKSQ